MWEALNLAYGYVFTVCLYVSQAEDLEGLVARDGIFHDPCRQNVLISLSTSSQQRWQSWQTRSRRQVE